MRTFRSPAGLAAALLILVACSGSNADTSFELLSDVLLEGNGWMVFRDLPIGADVDSLSIRLEGTSYVGTALQDGVERPYEMLLLFEVGFEVLDAAIIPPHGEFVAITRLYETQHPVDYPETLSLSFLYGPTDPYDEVVSDPWVQADRMELIVHSDGQVGNEPSTMGRVKALYR